MVTDDETAGITVSTPTLTIEEGDSDTYTVKLATEPTGAVRYPSAERRRPI